VRAHPPAAAGGLVADPQGDERTYNRERFLDRVALIREHVPDCAITTDIIVGFPGETRRTSSRRLEVAEEVGFGRCLHFRVLASPGTEAAYITEGPGRAQSEGRAHQRLVEVVQQRADEPRSASSAAHSRARRGAVAD
jgi:tRNA-2-methylthio-N6-dimethylallyladenosine synthase